MFTDFLECKMKSTKHWEYKDEMDSPALKELTI